MDIQTINNSLQPLKSRLLAHPLYAKIRTTEDLHCFLEAHVFAVWDFMSLLKALQQKLTCTTTPWFASANPETRYLINEIVLAEESDLAIDGSRQSHFEMYTGAMKACGADVSSIENFIASAQSLKNIFVAIRQSQLHVGVKSFLQFTFEVIDEGKPHKIAAAFTFGREDLIPSMFTEILTNFAANFPDMDLRPLIYYFERHIELDADEHGPMAMTMIDELCGSDPQKWLEAEKVSTEALEKRIGLWDAIEEMMLRPQIA